MSGRAVSVCDLYEELGLSGCVDERTSGHYMHVDGPWVRDWECLDGGCATDICD